ncbi:hypothetical protein ACGFR8_07600 [Streptomyces brevispora]|uniref:hypothetical protein n=1 Tax=Streptomyces brevispora TaxID=887462 RepID=UPI00370F9F8A
MSGGPYVIGVAVLVCSAGLVSAAAYLMGPAVEAWRRAHRAAPAPAASPDVVALIANGQAERLDFYHCPGEQRRRPHAVSVDGSRTCWHCGHHSSGDQT